MNNHNTTDEDIRKKEKKLDRNHWMCRIQKYIFGIDAPTYYMGYCPFFWMTWVSVICSPFIIGYRILAKVIITIDRMITKYDRARVEKRHVYYKKLMETPLIPRDQILIDVHNHLTDDAYNIIDFLYYNFELSYLESCRIRLWFVENPNWRETHLNDAIVRQKRFTDAVQARDHSKRKIVNTFSSLGPLVFKCLIPGIIVFATYLMYALMTHVILAIPFLVWVQTFILICFGLAGFLTCIITGDFLSNVWYIRRTKKIGKYTHKKEKGFLGHMFEFISDTIKTTYKQECPMIIWGEETGKITRRDNTKDSN